LNRLFSSRFFKIFLISYTTEHLRPKENKTGIQPWGRNLTLPPVFLRSAGLQPAVSPICNRQRAETRAAIEFFALCGLQIRDTADCKPALRRQCQVAPRPWSFGKTGEVPVGTAEKL